MNSLEHVNVMDAPAGLGYGVLAAGLVLGLFYCFLGYRFFHFMIMLTGFLLAGSVAAVLAGWLSGGRVAFLLLGLVLGGAAGAFALAFLYRAGVFCVGMLGGGAVALEIAGGTAEPWAALLIAVGAGAVGGLLALWLEPPVMVLATSALGALLMVHAVLLAGVEAALIPVGEDGFASEGAVRAAFWAWAVLGLLGAVCQAATLRKRRRKED